MIGARDMAFPHAEHAVVLDAVPCRGVIMLAGFFVDRRRGRGGLDVLRAALGRPASTPASTGARPSGCISLIVLGVSSLMGSVNYITTIINMRAPGMTLFRLPLTDLGAVHHGDPAAAGAAGAHGRR